MGTEVLPCTLQAHNECLGTGVIPWGLLLPPSVGPELLVEVPEPPEPPSLPPPPPPLEPVQAK